MCCFPGLSPQVMTETHPLGHGLVSSRCCVPKAAQPLVPQCWLSPTGSKTIPKCGVPIPGTAVLTGGLQPLTPSQAQADCSLWTASSWLQELPHVLYVLTVGMFNSRARTCQLQSSLTTSELSTGTAIALLLFA